MPHFANSAFFSNMCVTPTNTLLNNSKNCMIGTVGHPSVEIQAKSKILSFVCTEILGSPVNSEWMYNCQVSFNREGKCGINGTNLKKGISNGGKIIRTH